MEIQVIADGDVDESLDSAIRRLQVRAFPGQELFRLSRHYRHAARRDDLRVLGWEGDELAGQVVVFWIDASLAAGGQMKLAGIGSVCTDPDFRGRGVASHLLTIALDRAWQGGAGFALLFCDAERESLYRIAGFVPVQNEIQLTRLDGSTYSRDWHDIRMIAPLRMQDWPEGTLTLNVEDF